MGYVNNGDSRSLKVSVEKKLGGVSIQGYPKIYDGQISWGNSSYPTLTDIEVRRLSDVDFGLRYNAFVAYVQSVEAGVDFSQDVVGDGAIKTDPACFATTTTTTLVDSVISVFVDFFDLGQIDPGDTSICNFIQVRHTGTAGVISGTISTINTATSGDGTWSLYSGGACTNPVSESYAFTLSPGEVQYFSLNYASVLSDADTNVTTVLSTTHDANNVASPIDIIMTAHINP